MKNNTKKTQWSLLKDLLNDRTCQPVKNPKYVMYFVFIIVFVGSFGLFYDLMNINYCFSCDLDPEKVKAFAFNITNISLSLVTASVIDLIFISRKNVDVDNQQKNEFKDAYEDLKGNVRFFGLSSLILSFVLWILVNNLLESNYAKIIFATISLLFSYWIWWISNVKNEILSKGVQRIIGTIGGPIVTPNTPINKPFNTDLNDNELSGDIENFKS
jgi:hypothetical protein